MMRVVVLGEKGRGCSVGPLRPKPNTEACGSHTSCIIGLGLHVCPSKVVPILGLRALASKIEKSTAVTRPVVHPSSSEHAVQLL